MTAFLRSHQLDDKVYFEVPDSLLEAEILLVSRIAATANNIGYGGMKANTQVLRWQRQNKNPTAPRRLV